MSEAPLDATEVLARARRDGQSWVDEDVAARIAAGAAPATRAVAIARQSMPEPVAQSQGSIAPADAAVAGVALLAALESLAADDA